MLFKEIDAEVFFIISCYCRAYHSYQESKYKVKARNVHMVLAKKETEEKGDDVLPIDS